MSSTPIRHRRTWLATLCLAALLAGTTQADVAAAESALDLSHGAKLLTAEEARATDAETIAASTGSPVGVVQQRLALQSEANRFIESIPTAVRTSSFAGKITHPSGTRATLYFKDQVPAAVLSPAPAGITLQGGMRYSLTELIARHQSLHEALVELGFTQIRSGIDIKTQHITADVVLQAGKPSLHGAALRSATMSEVPHLRSHEVTLVEHAPGADLVQLEHGYGGAGIRDDGTRECTSGFSARRVSNGIGHFLTAAHCEGINQMEQNNASGGVDLVFAAPHAGEHIGASGDIELHATTGHDDYSQFWSNHNSRRTVVARVPHDAYGEGDTVCRYGRFSGHSCGAISQVVTSSTFVWEGCGTGGADCVRTAFNLVGVQGATSTGGDSGGPWFIGQEAYGIHHGRNVNTGERYFSRIQLAENHFGVRVVF